MIKFIIPALIVFLIVLFWEKINEYIKTKFNIKINYIILTVFLIALGIVLEILFGGAIPFLGDMNVVPNIMAILNGLSNEGLLGLVGVWVLYHIFNKK